MAKRTGNKILAVLGSVFVLVGVAGLTSLITKDIVERNAGLKDFAEVNENLVLKSGKYTEGFDVKKSEKTIQNEEEDSFTKCINIKSTKVTEGKDYKATQVIKESIINQYYVYQERSVLEFNNLNQIDFEYIPSVKEIISKFDLNVDLVIRNIETDEEMYKYEDLKVTISDFNLFTTNIYYTGNPEASKLDFAAGESSVVKANVGRIYYFADLENFSSIYNADGIEYFSSELEEDALSTRKKNVASHYFQIVIEKEFNIRLSQNISIEDLNLSSEIPSFAYGQIDWSSIKLNSLEHLTAIKDEIKFTKK